MPAPLVEKAFAKINLTLRVRGLRDDGFHDLESLVAFADLADTLSLQPGPQTALEVSGPFASASGKTSDNLVLKAAMAIGLPAGKFQLEKIIPVAAGLGGGSADAAAALRLLARASDLALDDRRFVDAAKTVGADVPVCLGSVPRIMRGKGEQLSAPLQLEKLPAVLVNPGVTLATRDVFAKFAAGQPNAKNLGNVPVETDALIDFLGHLGNDLTPAAISCLPVIADVLAGLGALPDVRLTRMSGSGPTCFGLFRSAGEATAAADSLRANHKGWWIHAGMIG